MRANQLDEARMNGGPDGPTCGAAIAFIARFPPRQPDRDIVGRDSSRRGGRQPRDVFDRYLDVQLETLIRPGVDNGDGTIADRATMDGEFVGDFRLRVDRSFLPLAPAVGVAAA